MLSCVWVVSLSEGWFPSGCIYTIDTIVEIVKLGTISTVIQTLLVESLVMTSRTLYFGAYRTAVNNIYSKVHECGLYETDTGDRKTGSDCDSCRVEFTSW